MRVRWLQVGVVVLVTGALAGCGAPAGGGAGVVEWIDRIATPMGDAAAGAPLDPPAAAAVRGVVGAATVVGIGESAHGLGDQFTLRERIARFLVEDMGFRTLAWEADYGSGVAVDRYVVDGVGDPRRIVGEMLSPWQSEQMLSLVEWMRAYNLEHTDDVRFLGTDMAQLRQIGLDEITRYVAAAAPDRSAELAGHLAEIGLRGSAAEHVGWYVQQQDKERLIAHARAVRDLVVAIPDGPGRPDVLHHADTVLAFYRGYVEGAPDIRERFMADSLVAWQRETGHRVVFWGANVHVAAAEVVEYEFPPTVPHGRLAPPVGHLLRQEYGPGYAVIAAVFGSGAVLQGFETGRPQVYEVPGPRTGTLDSLIGQATPATLLLDLRAPDDGPAVREWLDGPAEMRLIGTAYDAAVDDRYAMRVASLRAAFDAVVYVDRTDAARRLA